ncbi:hypothetical protein XENTR_v10009528 [Xenopus tropicalis]|nr:hypothetical protein XENTR_v10009528 [Xenopus tropicalis]
MDWFILIALLGRALSTSCGSYWLFLYVISMFSVYTHLLYSDVEYNDVIIIAILESGNNFSPLCRKLERLQMGFFTFLWIN